MDALLPIHVVRLLVPVGHTIAILIALRIHVPHARILVSGQATVLAMMAVRDLNSQAASKDPTVWIVVLALLVAHHHMPILRIRIRHPLGTLTRRTRTLHLRPILICHTRTTLFRHPHLEVVRKWLTCAT